MTKYVIKEIKAKIETLQTELANNIISQAYQREQSTPEAKKQVEAADKNMKDIETKIAWLKNYQKTLEK